MKTFKNIVKTGYIVLFIFWMQLFSISNQTSAAQSCSLNTFYWTVSVDWIPTDDVIVTIKDITNNSSLSWVTSLSWLYLIETANFWTCANPWDEIEVRATFNTLTASSTITYAIQALTNVNLSLTWTWDITVPGISYIPISSPVIQSEVPSNIPLTITDNVGVTSVTFSESW
ncbi:MAG: hypothetical protein ACD_4C00254G0001, partial [uncultured bacterium (gcode 4)]